MKKTRLGVFRATTDSREGLEEIVKTAQADPLCLWIVVKDRVLNRRGLVWRRQQGEEIDWWILADGDTKVEWRRH